MKRVRQYTFEVDFFKAKGYQFQAEAAVRSLGFEAKTVSGNTYYTLEYEGQRVDFHADYTKQRNIYKISTERPNSDSRIAKVKSFYKSLLSDLYIPSFSLSKGQRVTDTKKFIKSHLGYLDGLEKKAVAPYLDRLEALAQIIRIELL